MIYNYLIVSTVHLMLDVNEAKMIPIVDGMNLLAQIVINVFRKNISVIQSLIASIPRMKLDVVAGPTITQQPDENLIVQEGDNLTMSCYALGKPIPNIMWMFNGQRINPSSRFAWTNADGFGILVIRETQLNDSGIWSCYAENVKNITAGRGSVVMIKSKNAICTPPFFNSKANNQSECLRCHCFGVTNRCFSSNSKLVPNIVLEKDISLVVMRQLTDDTFANIGDLYPPDQQAIIYSPSIREFKINQGGIDPNTPDDAFFYWNLPSQFLGNQLNSYGGYLRYKFRYKTGFISKDTEIFDVVISGNNLLLFHRLSNLYSNFEDNKVEIRFWVGQWTKNEKNLRTKYSLNQIASREEIMRVLADLDYIYIRASYDVEFVESSILDTRMDTIAYLDSPNLPDAVFVEKCSCPEGYVGNSCEACGSRYIRHRDELYLGKCIKLSLACSCNGHSEKCDELTGRCHDCQHHTDGFNCGRCARGYYGDASGGQQNDCQPCPCPYLTPSKQLSSLWTAGFPPNWFSPTCYLDTDNDITCSSCPLGYEGRRCEKCAPGYFGDPSSPGESCKVKNMASLKAKIKIITNQSSTDIGDIIRLECILDGENMTKVYWTHIEHSRLPDHMDSDHGVLVIRGVSRKDEGIYRCHVETNAGVLTRDFLLTIPATKKKVSIGSNVTLKCPKEAKGTSMIQWTKEGLVLLEQQAHDSNSTILSLRNVTKSDSGLYICRVTLGAVTTECQVMLNVTSIPVRFRQEGTNDYVRLPPVPNAYVDFDIELSVKPDRTDDGLILYFGKYPSKGDFFSLGFRDNKLEFKFELGSGVTNVCSAQSMNIGEWHKIRINRHKGEVQMFVNSDPPILAVSRGKFIGLDLRDEPLYVGSLPDFDKTQDPVAHQWGFVGCISDLKVKDIEQHLLAVPEENRINVIECKNAPGPRHP
ncbi:basement membrane-specific heparan sulfate proteoglycan core protein-like isoform X2 [Brevipalpus obovatus]|uniref:basement membrane-specific heparan sulfate proteoglycan core protein-like isoform X2 n=1 Tax=Brevipalpus obovatus TaxID=246614 RepID=UPI003D9F54AF